MIIDLIVYQISESKFFIKSIIKSN